MSDQKTERRLRNQFPRTMDIPSQSSRFWAKEKDRYLRQLLIADIEEHTGREIIVCFHKLSETIAHTDADDFAEVMQGISGKNIDIILQTPGGNVDAVEKFISVVKNHTSPDGSYRVIIPGVAKSGGTVIALSSREILMGMNSELGPIDPQMWLHNHGYFPCELIETSNDVPELTRKIAGQAVARMKSLAEKLLREGMLRELSDKERKQVIEQISSSTTYNSHGAVIDFHEATKLKLNVTYMEPTENLWKKIWLLHCCYDHDMTQRGYGKVIEGATYSVSRLARPPQ